MWLLHAIVLTSCSVFDDTPSQHDGQSGNEDCAAWSGDPEANAFCTMTRAGLVPPLPESAETLCPEGGAWNEDCRMAWVTARLPEKPLVATQGPPTHGKTTPTEILLEACASDECRFLVIDARPNPDVFTQMDLCQQQVGVFAPDCVGSRHAALGDHDRGRNKPHRGAHVGREL